MTSPFTWYKNPDIEFQSGDSPLQIWYDSDKCSEHSKSPSSNSSNPHGVSKYCDNCQYSSPLKPSITNELQPYSIHPSNSQSLQENPSQQQEMNGIILERNGLRKKDDSCEPNNLIKHANHNDIGFGFGYNLAVTELTKTDKAIVGPLSPIKQKEDIMDVEINSHGENFIKDSPVRDVTGSSSQGNQQNERPRTPFSKHSSVIPGRFTSNIESPLASNYPPVSPFVYSTMNKPKERKKQSSSRAELILNTCSQKEPIPLKLIFENLREIKKVGEGVYGEAYVANFGANKAPRVYKIVAVEGDKPVNGEDQKNFTEILPEIIVSQEISRLEEGVRGCFTDGFGKLYATRVCKGKYPDCLIKAWKSWNKENNSDNDCPDFSPGQLYVIFESKFGGKDIEAYEFTTAKQTMSAVMQVAHIFAAGECALGFEHRDAHWGNILVLDTLEEYAVFILNGKSVKVPTYGVKVTVIDFTMSRITDDHGSPIYADLTKDEEQFLGSGDLQFDIYRMTRDYNYNDWSQFRPKSNILWVYYLADKMYFKGRYQNTHSNEHAVHLRSLQRLKDLILDYDSCYDFVTHYLNHLTNTTN